MASHEIGLSKPLADPADAVVDIVFVHGLNGDQKATWTDDTVFWPGDLLPKDVPNARIIAFGYRASIIDFFGPPSQNRLDNHADDFVSRLVGLRTQTGTTDRPIILVAHSLGGILCEQAVLSTSNRVEEATKQLSLSIRGIATLGTPHAGSDIADWAEPARQFMNYFVETNKTLLKTLQTGSITLATLQREYLNLLRVRAKTKEEIKVMCFFEGKSTKVVGKSIGKVVPEASACLQGYPNLSLYADHSSMCRFEGAEDEGYQKVKSVLQNWIKELQDPPKGNEGDVYRSEASFTGTFHGGIQQGQAVNSKYDIGPTTYNFGSASGQPSGRGL